MITLVFPWPPPELSPNARPPRWAKGGARGQAVQRYRHDCGWIAKAQMVNLETRIRPTSRFPLPTPVVAHVTFVVTDNRRRDGDNLLAMLKPLWDGMVDAGLIRDDGIGDFMIGSVTVERGKARAVRVRL